MIQKITRKVLIEFLQWTAIYPLYNRWIATFGAFWGQVVKIRTEISLLVFRRRSGVKKLKSSCLFLRCDELKAIGGLVWSPRLS